MVAELGVLRGATTARAALAAYRAELAKASADTEFDS